MGALVLGGVCGAKFQREALTEWDTAGGECVQWSHDHSAQDGAHYGEIHSIPGIQPQAFMYTRMYTKTLCDKFL